MPSASARDIEGTTAASTRAFDFLTDTFSYPNELIWEYQIDPQTGKTTVRRNDPPPTYAHHCFVVVRSAKQFFLHAKFDPRTPAASDELLSRSIRKVVSRSVQITSPAEKRICLPGFANLRELSAAKPDLLRSNCGGSWQSYVQRGNWRMVFPFTRRHQEKMAERLTASVAEKKLPIVHLATFPALTINHVLLVFAAKRTEEGIEFAAYDPNIPGRPVTLHFKTATRTFFFPATHYFAGGNVSVYEVYCGLFY